MGVEVLMRIVLLVLCAMLTFARSWAFAEEGGESGFTAHEWGVFTHYQNQAFANAACDDAWRELPKEVFGIVPGRTVPVQCLGANKPILYFYRTNTLNEKARMVDVRVDFPGGAPMVWHPATLEPQGGYYGMRRAGAETLTSVKGSPGHLRWSLNFLPNPQGALACPNFTWKDAALATDADLFSVANWEAQEHLKFVFYEGMVPNRNGIVLRVEKSAQGATKYFVCNTGKFEALDVWVIDCSAEGLKVGHLASLPSKPNDEKSSSASPGGPEKEVQVGAMPAGDAGVDKAAKMLSEQLTAAGLYRNEADGLSAIWKAEFFRTTGQHVIYRYPKAEYDRMLPIAIKPAPASIVRVGLAWLPHLEVGISERVMEQVKLMSNENFEVREAAFAALKKMGPSTIATLQHLAKLEKDPEVLNRIQALTNVTLDPANHLKEWERLTKQE